MTDNGRFERRIDGKLFLSILATGLMSFTGIVIETAMNVTFPTLMREFSLNISAVQWVTTGYLLMLAVIIPLSAFLKARFVMKRLFFTASVLFVGGTLLGAFAGTFTVLLVGRLLQGIGTGIALPLMFNIILEQAPLNRMGMMMGVASLICALSPAVGPSFGGWVVETFGWRAIFFALLPVIVLSFCCGMYAVRQSSLPSRPAFDIPSYFLLGGSFAALIFAVSFAGDYGWGSLPIITLLGLFFILLACFARRSGRIEMPLIHLDIFADWHFSLSVLALFIIQFITLGLGFLLPNFSQLVHGETPFAAGCILLPGCLIGALLAPVSGRVLDAYGPRRPVIFGTVMIVLATVTFSLSLQKSTTQSLTLIYIAYTIGQGFAAGNILTTGVRLLVPRRQSDGNAVCNTLQQLAGAVGTAVVSTVVVSGQQAHIDDLAAGTLAGSASALYVLSVLAVIACLAMGVTLRKKLTAGGESGGKGETV